MSGRKRARVGKEKNKRKRMREKKWYQKEGIRKGDEKGVSDWQKIVKKDQIKGE
jgi:hypothetical protein